MGHAWSGVASAAALAVVVVVCTAAAALAFMRETDMIHGNDRSTPPTVEIANARTLARRYPAVDYTDAILAINYHDISDRPGPYTTSPEEFARQLAALRAAGYRSVPLESVEALAKGRPVELPRRPILITFDDGAQSAWTNADPILERFGFRATMFVITGSVASNSNSYYLTWDQLRAMKQTGRWDFGAHTDNQHRALRVLHGESPALINRGLTSGGQLESLASWRRRIERDFDRADRALHDQLGVIPFAFAYPFAADSTPTNDRRIPGLLRQILTDHYSLAFGDGTSGHAVITRNSDSFAIPRLRVSQTVTDEALLKRLQADVPLPFDRPQTLGWSGEGGRCVLKGSSIDVTTSAYARCRPVGNSDVWHDYRIKTVVTGVAPAATATVTARDGIGGRLEVLLGASVARARQQVGTGAFRELGTIPLAPSTGTRSLEISLKGNRANIVVDGKALSVTLDPAISAGGVTLGAALRAPGSIRYSNLSLASLEAPVSGA